MTFFMKNNIYWILEDLTETVLQLTKQIENDSRKRADFVFAERGGVKMCSFKKDLTITQLLHTKINSANDYKWYFY